MGIVKTSRNCFAVLKIIGAFCVLCSISTVAQAQIDPATSLLIQSSDSGNGNLDSSRYVTRPAPVLMREKPQTPKAAPAKVATPVQVTHPKYVSTISTVAQKVKPIKEKTSKVPTTSTTAANAAPTPTEYRWYEPLPPGIYPKDERYNIADISIAPGVFYASAASAYWYRRYFTSSPSVDANIDLWFNPSFGLKFNYFTSLGASIHDSPTSDQSAPATTQIYNGGVNFRKYFSPSRRSPSVTFSLAYNQYNLNVPSADKNRIDLNTSGPDFGFLLKYPTSVSQAWLLSSDIMPSLTESEHTTGISVSSGDSPSAYAVKIGFGKEFMLSRGEQVFWKLSERYDKVIYLGTASQADPASGGTPSGVDVSTSTTIFEVGITWGD